MNKKIALAFFLLLIINYGHSSPLVEEPLVLNKYEIPGFHDDHAYLGKVFKNEEKQLENKACLTGDIVETKGGASSKVEIVSEMSFKDALSKVTGALNANVNFPLVRAGAGVEMAKEYADTESSKSFHFIYKVKHKKRVYRPGTYRLTSLGKKHSKDKKNLYKNCGDSFITGIEYGGTIHANLRFDFRNKKDKETISGKINVDVGPKGDSIVKINGSLKNLSIETKNSVKITIKAEQFGGDPIKLSKIINPKAIQCTLVNPAKCLKTFENVMIYAKDQYPIQFDSLDKYSRVSAKV